MCIIFSITIMPKIMYNKYFFCLPTSQRKNENSSVALTTFNQSESQESQHGTGTASQSYSYQPNPCPTTPPQVFSPPEYLEVIDQSQTTKPMPTSDGEYMNVDRSTVEKSLVYPSSIAKQYPPTTPPPTTPPLVFPQPEYLEVIDQSQTTQPVPTSDEEYMDIDRSTVEKSFAHPSSTAKQYPPTTPSPVFPQPEYLEVIDQSQTTQPRPLPTSDEEYMDIDRSTVKKSRVHRSATAEQYSYVSPTKLDQLAKRPSLPLPT